MPSTGLEPTPEKAGSEAPEKAGSGAAETVTLSKPTAVGAVVLLALLIVPMGLSGTAVALPRISATLGANEGLLQWAVNGFNIAFAIFTLVWGLVSDRIGYRTTFRLGVALYLCAALVTATACARGDRDRAGAGRGLGGGGVHRVGLGHLHQLRGPGPEPHVHALRLDHRPGPRRRPRRRRAAHRPGGLARHVRGARGLARRGTGRRSVIIPARARTAAAVSKLIDLTVLRDPRFLSLCLVAVAGSIGFVTMLTYLPTGLAAVGRLDTEATGWYMLPLTVPVLCCPFLGAWAARRIRGVTPAIVIRAGLGLLLAGLAGTLVFTPGNGPLAVLAPTALIGTGFGMSLGLVDAQALDSVPPDQSGTAAGVLNFFRMGSEAIFVALYGVILHAVINARVPDRHAADAIAAGLGGDPDVYAYAFRIAAITLTALLALTIICISLLMRIRTRNPQLVPESGS